MKRSAIHTRIPALILVMSMLFPGIAFSAAEPANKTVSPDSVQLLSKISAALAEVANVAKPSVVNISTTSTISAEEGPGDLFNDPFFRRFFGDQDNPKRKFKSASLGSGVIVSENGYILTNNHVIKGAEEIKVLLSDKREFKGKVVGNRPQDRYRSNKDQRQGSSGR